MARLKNPSFVDGEDDGSGFQGGQKPRQTLPVDPNNPFGPLIPSPPQLGPLIPFTGPDGGDGIPSQSSQTPVERPPTTPGGGVPPTTSAPPRPKVPTPVSATPGGGTSMPESTAPGPGGEPFMPLPSSPVDSLVTPRVGRRSLYGSHGGQLGGGLGTPFDPTSNNASDPISSLIQALLSKRGMGIG